MERFCEGGEPIRFWTLMTCIFGLSYSYCYLRWYLIEWFQYLFVPFGLQLVVGDGGSPCCNSLRPNVYSDGVDVQLLCCYPSLNLSKPQ